MAFAASRSIDEFAATSHPNPPLVAVENDRELTLQPEWPASTPKPFVPWLVSIATLAMCTGNGLVFVTDVSTSAVAPGYSTPEGVPPESVSGTALVAAAVPVPLPVTVQAA